MIYRCKLSTNMKRPQTFQKIVSYHIEWDSFNSITFMIDRSNAVNLENMSYPFVCSHTSLVSFVCLLWVFMPGTHCHWAVRVLYRATPALTRGICLLWSSERTRDTHTCCRAFGSGAITTCIYDKGLSRLGFKNPIFRMRGKHSNQQRHRRSLSLLAWRAHKQCKE